MAVDLLLLEVNTHYLWLFEVSITEDDHVNLDWDIEDCTAPWAPDVDVSH
jgi:hypothetical protein